MVLSRNRFSPTVCLLSCLTLLPCGCGQKETGIPVSGQVKLDGAPLTGVSLNLFDTEKGVSATSLLDADGKFEMANSLPPGTYVVTVSPPLASHPAGAEGKPTIPKLPANLPKKVMDLRTSDVKATIAPPVAVLDLQISSKKTLGR